MELASNKGFRIFWEGSVCSPILYCIITVWVTREWSLVHAPQGLNIPFVLTQEHCCLQKTFLLPDSSRQAWSRELGMLRVAVSEWFMVWVQTSATLSWLLTPVWWPPGGNLAGPDEPAEWGLYHSQYQNQLPARCLRDAARPSGLFRSCCSCRFVQVSFLIDAGGRSACRVAHYAII